MFGARARKSAYWAVDFFNGGTRLKHFKDIYEINSSSKPLLERINRYLNNIVEHAIQTVPQYKTYRQYKKFADFPIINKSVIKEDVNQFLSTRYRKRDLYSVSTSGSTGTPLVLWQNVDKRKRHNADLIYFGKMCGYEIGDRYVYLRVWSDWKRKSKLSNWKQNVVPFDVSNLDYESLHRIFNIIDRGKVQVLIGYAKTLQMIAEYLLENSIVFQNPCKVVISSGENLTKNMKTKIEKAFDCHVVSRYAMEEVGFLAQQPIEGDYFLINDASFYVEFLKPGNDEQAKPGEISRVVVTDLFNRACPLIRYDTGDLAKYEFNPEGKKIITELYGRAADFLYDTKGKKLVSFSITNHMERVQNVKQFQLIQTDEKAYNLKIVPRTDDFTGRKIVSRLRSILGEDAIISLEIVESISPLTSGKYKAVICEL